MNTYYLPPSLSQSPNPPCDKVQTGHAKVIKYAAHKQLFFLCALWSNGQDLVQIQQNKESLS